MDSLSDNHGLRQWFFNGFSISHTLMADGQRRWLTFVLKVRNSSRTMKLAKPFKDENGQWRMHMHFQMLLYVSGWSFVLHIFMRTYLISLLSGVRILLAGQCPHSSSWHHSTGGHSIHPDGGCCSGERVSRYTVRVFIILGNTVLRNVLKVQSWKTMNKFGKCRSLVTIS